MRGSIVRNEQLWKTSISRMEADVHLWKTCGYGAETVEGAARVGITPTRAGSVGGLIHKEVPKSCVFRTLLHKVFHRPASP